ncbi:PKD domain-containing protein [Hymenobacter sp. BT175]|uniref:endo-beta-N-acetylglucosaminidase n=1 Tax=Hymenobacter translucens TaxID=2886507 RepID=UPI001D0F0BFA|nr:LamG-like jellyroll fold domain-containing protein [Hymenobacter translucens]MCC2545398.1 PKD domain-containing protein [Hymenobacter translucens]
MKQRYLFLPFLTFSAVRSRVWLSLILLTSLGISRAAAQMEPAAQYTKLTPTQLLAWTPTGPTAVPDNVSRVPLASRQNSLASQLNPAQSFSHRINYVPDGMATWGGYLNEQNRFNLFNFTHWQYIDVLTWFDGPVAIPTRPWVETAHRNGVKVIGSVFTSAADVNVLIQKDALGNYPAARKLVDVAAYYGFDGWFFNQESSVPAATATEFRNLLKQLQQLRPAGMEIHWYDAMLPGGNISYQNALNANNQLLFQEGPTRVSDAMFTNYFWSGATNINTSVATANALGRSPFDVYMGADLWPTRSNQSMFARTTWADNYFVGGDLTQPRLSFGLFATNLTYNGGFNSFSSNAADYASFYRTEQRLFAGDDFDVTIPDATGWKGFGHYVPVRSVIHTLPFDTYFSVGQGKVFANNGVQLVKNWTDMAKQSLLPSWQWAKTGAAPVTVGFDFDEAYYAGNSLKLAGSLSGTNSATVKLYQSRLPITAQTSCELIFKAAAGATNTRLALYFADNLATPELLDLGAVPSSQWEVRTFSLAPYAGRELAVIGVQAASATPVANYQLNLGRLRLFNGSSAPTAAPVVSFTASATTVTTNQPIQLTNSTTNGTAYRWTFVGGTPASSTAVHPVVSYAAAGTYAIKLWTSNAAGRDSLTRTSYITVVAPGSGSGNSALLYDGATKYVDAGPINLSGPALSMECWLKPAAFKTVSPFISSVMGIEDSNNTALIRLGDAGLAANRLQFVLTIGGMGRKLNSATSLSANTWYHVAATYDGSAMKLYVNGQLDATLSVSGNAAASGVFTFGRNYDGNRMLSGSLDELRVWTRALTTAEIQANACAVSATAPGLEGYWPCNEGTGTVALDVSGHGHLGTLLSMVPADWSTDVPAQCRLTAVGPGRTTAVLQVRVLGNPVQGRQAEVEVEGAQGQPVRLQLLSPVGRVVGEVQLQPSAARQRYPLPFAPAPGLYLLRVLTPTGSASTRLLQH